MLDGLVFVLFGIGCVKGLVRLNLLLGLGRLCRLLEVLRFVGGLLVVNVVVLLLILLLVLVLRCLILRIGRYWKENYVRMNLSL